MAFAWLPGRARVTLFFYGSLMRKRVGRESTITG